MNFKEHVKGARKSLTIWFNGALLAALPVLEVARETVPQLQEYLSESTYRIMGLVVVVVNIALRFKTKGSLAEK